MSIAHIYKENDEVIIIGSSEELEALGHILISKSKLKDNLSAKLISDSSNTPNIIIDIYNDN